MHVLLLSGGTSDEREVSLRSGDSIAKALQAAGHAVTMADPQLDTDIKKLTQNIDVVFLALHGKGGEDGTIQAELENLSVPFVGSGSKASRLCFDKAAYKQFLLENNFPVVSGRTVSVEDIQDPEFHQPYVLKPIDGGSSLDTQIVRKTDDATLHTSNNLLQRYGQMLFEPLIEGVEITIGVLNDMALPVIEIIPPEGAEFDYENKYNGATKEVCPPIHVSESKQHEAKLLALDVHRQTGCRQMSRTDMIIDTDGRIHILETNTIPGFTDQSLYPKMAAEAGIPMPQLVDQLVKNAIN